MNKPKNRATYWQCSVQAVLACALYMSNTAPLLALMPLTVKVVIQQGTCDISNQAGTNQPITVDFGDMAVRSINGIAYQMLIPYRLTCANSGSNPALWMSLSGTGAAFNTQLLSTSNALLGLRLSANQQTVALGERINFSYQQPPSLSVTPIMIRWTGVSGGGFTATATLSVNYQ